MRSGWSEHVARSEPLSDSTFADVRLLSRSPATPGSRREVAPLRMRSDRAESRWLSVIVDWPRKRRLSCGTRSRDIGPRRRSSGSCVPTADRWVAARFLERRRRRAAPGRPARPSRSPRHPPASPHSGHGCERVAGGRTLALPSPLAACRRRHAVSAERLVLAGLLVVRMPYAARSASHRAVTGVVRKPVSDDDAGEQRRLVQALLGLAQERGPTGEVPGHHIETSSLDQREHRRLLDAGEQSQRQALSSSLWHKPRSTGEPRGVSVA